MSLLTVNQQNDMFAHLLVWGTIQMCTSSELLEKMQLIRSIE